MRVEPLDASADLPTAQSAPSASASAVRAAAQKRKREDPRDDSDVGSPTDTAAAAPKPSSCVHEVAIPEGWEGDLDALHNPTYDGPRAKAYPFTLDAFQETSVAVLERNESVMVAAHTSAGKTVVAEYAIAMAFRDKQRVIYTSPLKALSNQKFRELTEEFGGEDGSQVGLMTGDVSINPNATCVVMTTEVLRSMLYRGSDISREVKWIIFDEVHYMRDRERGVIWEESIIFAPPGAKMVFLSATLPNAKQFADWVTHMHKHPCHVVYTDHRPTPLVHYCFPKGGRKPIQVINERREFDDRNFALLVDELERGEADRKSKRQNVGDGGGRGRGGGGRGGGGRGRGGGGRRGRGGGGGGGGGGDGGEDMYNLFKHILSKELLPTIVFSFSRRECEEHPKALTKLNFTTDAEKETIQEIYDNALLCMSEEDRELKAVQEILPILRRGIGIHHSGLLPIVKELVEILFGESLIKVLFATETFAMGLNMPARCVVFTAFKKFDGENMRVVAPGEYTQMSGRAGRRGKDPCGTCIMMVDEKMGKEDVTSMVLGEPQPLNSEFKLTYYQILNLLKRASGTVNTEYVIARSFHQFQHAVNVPAWRARLAEVETARDAIVADRDASTREYQDALAEAAECERQLWPVILERDDAVAERILRPGRVVRVVADAVDWGWGVVVGRDPTAKTADVLLHYAPGAERGMVAPASRAGGRIEPGASAHVTPTATRMIRDVYAYALTLPEDLRDRASLDAVGTAVDELRQRMGDEAERFLDPSRDAGVSDPSTMELSERLRRLRKQARKHPLARAGSAREASDRAFEKLARYDEEATELKRLIRTTELSKFREELERRVKVLRRLGHVNDEHVVQLKGRAACEIDTADELLVTELMFNGCFGRLDHHQLVALCSCFMPVEKSKEGHLGEEVGAALAAPMRELENTARLVGEEQRACGLAVDVDDFVDSFKPTLAEVVYAWSKGAHFDDVMKKTDLFEGTVIRAMRRLDELMMELHRAASAVGDETLAEKFAAGAESLRHGIVFATSLYL